MMVPRNHSMNFVFDAQFRPLLSNRPTRFFQSTASMSHLQKSAERALRNRNKRLTIVNKCVTHAHCVCCYSTSQVVGVAPTCYIFIQ